MMRGERTLSRRHEVITAEASAKWSFARLTTLAQARPSLGWASTFSMSIFVYTGFRQSLPGEVEASHGCVLVKVAEDVRHLQRAAEVMRQLPALLIFDAENSDRKSADRRSHPVAIELERRPIRSPHIVPHIHLHTADDGEEVLLPQIEDPHRTRKPLRELSCAASGSRGA